MGIYISGINLPRGKHSIVEITITEDGTVFTGSTDTFHKSDLRAVEVDSHHGRLIDVGAMEKTMSDAVLGDIRNYPYDDETWRTAFDWLDNQPSIIEAEE